jgi:diguanylate cyclase (GGDEF)-like protein
LVTVLVMVRIRKLTAERLRAERALSHLASHDPLTGLINRRELMARLGDEHCRSPHDVILFCDLDKFKEVNDRFGHAAGDELLTEVAHRLEASVRKSDTVARLGGDEFLILLTDAGHSDVNDVLQRISALLSAPVVVSGQSIDVNASIGVIAADDGEPEALLRRADHAMYRAKQSQPTEQGVRVVSN